MLFRYDLRMPGRSGVHVKERDEVVILIDPSRGDLSGDDLAENAVLHVFLLSGAGARTIAYSIMLDRLTIDDECTEPASI